MYTRNNLTGDLAPVNAELEKIEQELQKVLGSGTSSLEDDLDANSKRITNLPDPVTDLEPLRKKDAPSLQAEIESTRTLLQDADTSLATVQGLESNAEASKVAAEAARDAAQSSASEAQSSEVKAQSYKDAAETSATDAASSLANIGASEVNAANSASAAALSATAASTSESNASTSETNAAQSALDAQNAATGLQNAEANAAQSATDAEAAKLAVQSNILEIDTTVRTSSFVAETNKIYLVDASSSSLDIPLPTGAVNGKFAVIDYKGTFSINNAVLKYGSDPIMGLSEDNALDIDNLNLELLYVDSTEGWKYI